MSATTISTVHSSPTSRPGPSPPTNPHRQDIQGLRGMAVLAVVAFHADTFVRGGFVGVDVFFVISGYVITASIARELARSGTLDIPAFYVRRVRRLLPALGVVVLAALALSVPVLAPAGGRQAVAETARAASLFLANIHLSTSGGYFAPASDRNPLLHTWSLSIEEQFYAVLPMLLLGAWTIGRARGNGLDWSKRVVIVVTVGSFAWAAAVVATGEERAAFYLPHLRAWEFGVGALLALDIGRLSRLSARGARIARAAGGGLVLSAVLAFSATTPFPGPSASVPVVGTALLIAGGAWPGRRAPILGARWLVWIGDRSYSWYLWHWPLLTFAVVRWPEVAGVRLVAALVALVPASVSFALIEQPIRADRRIVGVAAAALALILVVAPVATASAIEQAADEELARNAPELGELTRVWVSGCGDLPWPEQECTYGSADAAHTVALIGDSHASVLGDVVTHVGEQLDARTIAFTRAGCPIAPLDDASTTCDPWRRATLRRLRAIGPDVVVVAHRAPLYVYGRGIADDPSKPIASTEAEALAMWDEGLDALIRLLDTPILVINTVPEQPRSVVDQLGTGASSARVAPLSVGEHLERSGGPSRVERSVVERFPEALGFDPTEILCDSRCPARADGEWRYFDASHLTPRATLLFAQPLRTLMQQLLSGELTSANR